VGSLVAEPTAPGAWAFFLGTWTHVDEFGATHTFVFSELGVYGVYVSWEKCDALLGVVPVASEAEAVFFDDEAEEDLYAIVAWDDPIEAYGVFYNPQEVDEEGNDRLLLTVYRYVTLGGLESSRENFRMVMPLTRMAEDP
jgi:hypothetical protein